MKFLSILIILGLSTSSSNAFVFQSLDKLLLDSGIVDRNYKYIDKSAAYEAFRVATNEVASSLPVKINAYIEVDTIFFTPYVGNYAYTIDMLWTKEELNMLQRELTAPSSIKDLCDTMYDAKFQKANDFVLNIFYNDRDGKNISTIILDKDTCFSTRWTYIIKFFNDMFI